jgi:hypothetical protein
LTAQFPAWHATSPPRILPNWSHRVQMDSGTAIALLPLRL